MKKMIFKITGIVCSLLILGSVLFYFTFMKTQPPEIRNQFLVTVLKRPPQAMIKKEETHAENRENKNRLPQSGLGLGSGSGEAVSSYKAQEAPANTTIAALRADVGRSLGRSASLYKLDRSREKRKIPIREYNTEEYDRIYENGFKNVLTDPLSTFSIDVDAASYSNIRRFLRGGALPYPDAVRIEEMINYFKYDYPQPEGEHPFSITSESAVCPWNTDHKLILVGLQGKNIPLESLPPNNLVFLIDVSGSMESPDKLPLVKSAFPIVDLSASSSG